MASYNQLDIVGQNKARQKRLRVLAEIGCILLFILFMLPFFIVLMNSARTNAEIINSAVGCPATGATSSTTSSPSGSTPPSIS